MNLKRTLESIQKDEFEKLIRAQNTFVTHRMEHKTQQQQDECINCVKLYADYKNAKSAYLTVINKAL